jgi:hypothetical protein
MPVPLPFVERVEGKELDFVQLECERKSHKGSREVGVCCTLTVTVCSQNSSLIIRSGRLKV